MAAAAAIAAIVPDDELREDYIIPSRVQPRRAPTPSPRRSPQEAQAHRARRDGRATTIGFARDDDATQFGASSAAPDAPYPRAHASDRHGSDRADRQRLVAALRERGDEVTVLSRDPERRARSASRPSRWDPVEPAPPGDALAGRDARRPPRRRERRPALERRAPSSASANRASRHPQPRGGTPRGRAAPARAGRRLGRRLLRPARRRARRRVHAGRRRLPRRGLRGLGARGRRPPRTSGCASCAAHRRRARPRRRRAGEDAAAVQARRRRPGRRRAPVHAVDPRRRRRRHLPRRARRRRAGRAGQRQRARAGDQQRRSPRRSAARCTAPPSRPIPGSRCRLLYGDMAEIVTTGAARDPAPRARSSATPSRTPTSTRRCAQPWRACRRCLAAKHPAPQRESGLGRPGEQPDDDADDAEDQPGARGPASRRSPCGRERYEATIAESSQSSSRQSAFAPMRRRGRRRSCAEVRLLDFGVRPQRAEASASATLPVSST